MSKRPPLARLHSRLKIRHMQLLKTLGATPNLRRAAASLSMSQPVASTLLREVEDALGERLFERTARGLQPTAAGQAMARWARLVLADLESAREDLGAIGQGQSRRLRVGITPVAAPTLVPRAVAAFRQQFPKATIAIQTGVESTLTDNLARGELDCVVCRLVPEASSSALSYTTLYSERSYVVVGMQHPLAKVKELAPRQLDAYEWILPVSQGAPYNLVAKRLLDEGCRLPRVAIETWSTVVIVNMLKFTDCLAVLPHTVAHHHSQSGVISILPFTLPDALLPIAVLTRAGIAGNDELLLAFVDSIQKAVRESAKGA
jgi:DNA-binding transcriptional LysR family regulator